MNQNPLESGPQRKAYLVYRSNDVYDTLHAGMVAGIRSAGYEVSEQVFPKGTPVEEITKWANNHVRQLVGAKLIMDETSGRAMFKSDHVLAQMLTTKEGKYDVTYTGLDGIIDGASCEAVFGADVIPALRDRDNPINGDEGYKLKMVELLKIIFSNKNNIPKKVFIIPAKMGDHFPRKEKRPGLWVGPEDEVAVERVSSWFVEAGLDPSVISVTENFQEIDPEVVQGESTWFILDRHAVPSGGDGASNKLRYIDSDYEIRSIDNLKGKVLQLPMINFIEDITKKRLIAGDTAKVSGAVKEALKNYLS
jgi:hypothetical protein